MNSTDLVILTGDTKQAVTTSLKLAAVFGRKHKNILASIRASIKINGNAGYTENEYRDSSGRMQTMYYVDRIGFVSLNIAGHTEEKLKVIRAFNEAEGKIEESLPLEIVEESQWAEYKKPISSITIEGKVLDIFGTPEDPIFKAKDVADLLEVVNHRDLYSRVDEGNRTKLYIEDEFGVVQLVNCLTEDGFYEACVRSRKEIAHKIRKQVGSIFDELRSKESIAGREDKPIASMTIAGKTIAIYGSVEKPLFKASDVAEILGITNDGNMIARLDEDEVDKIHITDSIGRVRLTNCVTEEGLYEACFQSRTEVAKNFKKQVKAYLKELRLKGSVSVQPSTPMSTAQFLLQQAQFMVEQEQRLSEVEEKLEQMEQERVEAGQLLLEIDTSDSKPVPAITMRSKVNELVNAYATAHNVSQPDIFHYIYRELYYRYGVRVNSLKILTGETKLMALERNNHLPKVYDIVCHLPERLTN